MPRVLALRALLLITAMVLLPCASAQAAPPAGDSFASPFMLTGTDVTANADTTEATREGGEPNTNGQGSVWFEWTAPATGQVVVHTAGSDFDTWLIVTTGDSLAALNGLAGNDDAHAGTKTSRTGFEAVKGTRYRIFVDGTSPTARGSLTLSLKLGTVPPANDTFAGATLLPSEAVVSASGDSLGSTAEAGEPNHYPWYGSTHSLWYSWTAPSTGSLTIEVTPSPGQIPVLAAYAGDTLTGLTRVAGQAQAYDAGPQRIRIRVEAGVTYRIAIEAFGIAGEFKLALELIDSPLNDDFASALPLAGAVAEAAGNTVGATQQPCEPVHDDNYYDPSVWYTWTAPASGGVTIDTGGSDYPTVLGIYTGDVLCSLARVPVTRLTGVGVPAKRTFRATAGVTYRIAVDGQNGRTGSYRLSLRQSPVPANDLFVNASPLTGATVRLAGSNLGATGESGEPSPGGESGATVWYRWTAPTTGMASLKLDGVAFGGGLAAYTGTSVDALTLVQRGSFHGMSFRAQAGTTYLIAVDGGTLPNQGDFTLDLSHSPSPPNDDLAGAIQLAGSSDTRTATNRGATREPGEPYLSYSRDSSVWFTWTAPSAGAVAIDTRGSSINTVLGVYTGDTVDALGYVTGNNNASYTDTSSRVTFRAEAGTTYRIVVNSEEYATGDVKLRLTHGTTPANDSFAAALPLPSAAAATAAGSTLGASHESGEPPHYSYDSPQGSVWYAWTAPSSGSLTIKATADFQPVLAAYTGSTLTGLQRVNNQAQDWNGGPEQIRIRVQAGTTYYIAIDARLSLGGEFSLSLALIPSPANDDFANPHEIVGRVAEIVGSTVGATQEACEPVHDDNYYDPSVWFTWTAPESGGVVLDTTGSDFPTVVAAYTGDKLCELVRMPLRRLSAVGQPAKRGFRAVAGKTYRIAVDGANAKMGNYSLSLRHTPPPLNDMFAAAQKLTGTAAKATGSNVGATGEPGELAGDSAASVWYEWTAPQTGLAVVKLNADFAATITGYRGDALGSLSRLGTWDHYRGRYSFAAVEGETYRIAIDGAHLAAEGDFTLELGSLTSPANDDFADAVPISGATGNVTGTTTGATAEPNEPNNVYYESGTVWYAWTAPQSGLVVFTLPEGDNQNDIYGFTGDTLQTLTRARGTSTFHATKGTTYRIAVGTSPTVDDSAFRMTWWMATPPRNDAFADAVPLSGTSLSEGGTTVGAGREEGEPPSSTYYASEGGATVWYSWTAPSSGLASVSNDNGFAVAAYRGDALGSLKLLTSASWYEGAYFPVLAGETYRIRVEGNDYATSGSFRLHVSLVGSPANDDFENAAEFTGSASGTTTGATQQAGEQLFDSYKKGTVWYRWRPERAGTATLQGPSYTHGLGVYTGDSLGSLKYRGGASYGTARLRVAADTTYWIAISSQLTRYARAFTLTADVQPGPPNDDFADAAVLSGDSDSESGSNVNASPELGEQHVWSGDNTVWYRWTSPITGRVVVDLSGSSFDTVLSAFEGSSVDRLTTIGTDYDGGEGNTSRLSVEVRAGTTYHFAVSGYYGASGAIALSLSTTLPPPNDDFASAQELSGRYPTADGTNDGATRDPGQPYLGSGASVWYAWTAPADGEVTVRTHAPGFTPMFGVYQGAAPAALWLVTSSSSWDSGNTARTTFYAYEGNAYRVMVDGYAGGMGPFELSLSQPQASSGGTPPPQQYEEEPGGVGDPPSGDPPSGDPQPGDSYQPSTVPPSGSPPAGHPQGPPVPAGPPKPAPLRLSANFARQKLGAVLSSGLSGFITCSAACDLDVVLTIDPAAAKKAKLRPSALHGARVTAQQAGDWKATHVIVRLPKAIRSKLGKTKTLPVTVRVVATAGGQRAEQTIALKLKR